MRAAGRLLAYQKGSPSRGRITEAALLLTLALVWFMNGLHSRPQDDEYACDLMAAALPTTDDPANKVLIFSPPRNLPDRPDDAATPYIPAGVIFLRDIQISPATSTPRFKIFDDGRRVSDATFLHFFHHDSLSLCSMLHQSGFQRLEDIHPQRVPVAKIHTRDRIGPIPHPDAFNDMEPIQPDGYFDLGPDRPLDEQIPRAPDAPDVLNKLWSRFLIDVLQVSGKPRNVSEPSYVRLSATQRRRATEDVYTQTNLAIIFNHVTWRNASHERWSAIFNHLWPDKNHVLSKSQNYKACQYYLSWKNLTSEYLQSEVTKLRAALKARFDTLYWVPSTQSDRMWNTRTIRRGEEWTRYPPKSKGPAPQIEIHPDRPDPTWDELARPHVTPDSDHDDAPDVNSQDEFSFEDI